MFILVLNIYFPYDFDKFLFNTYFIAYLECIDLF